MTENRRIKKITIYLTSDPAYAEAASADPPA